jgi:hypothetical protein
MPVPVAQIPCLGDTYVGMQPPNGDPLVDLLWWWNSTTFKLSFGTGRQVMAACVDKGAVVWNVECGMWNVECGPL